MARFWMAWEDGRERAVVPWRARRTRAREGRSLGNILIAVRSETRLFREVEFLLSLWRRMPLEGHGKPHLYIPKSAMTVRRKRVVWLDV
jgi:hypothetical protein